MIPPPAPARPLISASDISPCSYSPIPAAPLLYPASPAGGSQRRAEQNWTPRRRPQRVASAACCSVSLDCGRRKRGRGVGVGVGVAEWTRLGSRLGAPTGVPVSRAFFSLEFRFQKAAAACRAV